MEYRILKEASLIETENYPCHNNRAGVETGNNGMSGDSFWVPESSDINFLLFLYQADIFNDGNCRWLDPTEDGVQWLSTIQHLTMHRLRFHTWHLYLQSLFWDNRIIFWVLLISLSVDKSICSPPPPSPFFNKKKSQKIWNKICSSNYYFTVINQ